VKPLRKWKAECPCCTQFITYDELGNEKSCPVFTCKGCKTEFVCPNFRFHCSKCANKANCMRLPLVHPLLIQSTWKAFFQSRRLGLKELSKRDWNYLYRLNPEEVLKLPDVDEEIFQSYSKRRDAKLKTPITIYFGFFHGSDL